jgi:hypothetical protein
LNFAPLLSLLATTDFAPANPEAMDTWLAAWENAEWDEPWPAEDAANWDAETGVLAALLEPRPFGAFAEVGAGLGRVSEETRYTSWAATQESGFQPRGEWDEAVELSDGTLLVYPNDDGRTPRLAFYASLAPARYVPEGDEPVRLGIVAFQLGRRRRVKRTEVFVASDGMCARWLITSSDGSRDLTCRRDKCANDCRRDVSIEKGGIRTATCIC